MFIDNILSRDKEKERCSFRKAISCFLASLLICIFYTSIGIYHKLKVQSLSMEQIITEKSIKISEVISKLLYKTQALAALVIQGDGEIREFDRMAATIVDNPAILNILLAPGGVVSHVYPKGGNEKLIGYNLFGSGAGNKEALLAREKGELVFGGPFTLMQGGTALVGRLPVWINRGGGERMFWGLASVTLRYPEALLGAELNSLAREGFYYEVWRDNPDDGQPQIIASSLPEGSNNTLPYIERGIHILNANWFFRIMPARYWYQFPENWALIGVSVCISLLIGLIVRNNEDLKRVKRDLEIMVRTDALTGILNRAGLFHAVSELLEKGVMFELHYLDLNHFKQINDTFGHSMGDQALIVFCRRLGRRMAKHHTLARISGDEFALLSVSPFTDEGKERLFWEGLEREFEKPIFSSDGIPIYLSYSKGRAAYPEDGTSLDALIACADQRMYQDKENKYTREKKRRASDLKAAHVV